MMLKDQERAIESRAEILDSLNSWMKSKRGAEEQDVFSEDDDIFTPVSDGDEQCCCGCCRGCCRGYFSWGVLGIDAE